METDETIFGNLIASRAASQADDELLTFVNITAGGEFAEETRTYRQLWDQGQKLAAAFQNQQFESGQNFALLMQNHPEFVDAMVASSICGTVFVPIDPRIRGDKLAYMLQFTGCKGVIVADYALQSVIEVLDRTPDIDWLWVLATGTLAELPNAGVPVRWLHEVMPATPPSLPVAATDPAQTMQMLFTSGTTGDPKAIVAPYARFDGVASIGPLIGLQPGDRLYTGLSLSHANAQLITLGNALKMGLPCIISRKFTKSRLWEICRRYRCTIFNLLGGMTTAIYSEPPRSDDADNPVRQVLSAGMPAVIWEKFARRFDVAIFEFYGAAEGGLTFNPPNSGPIGSIGKPPPNLEGRIVDAHDGQCAPGEPGEIVFRNADGSCPAVSYYQNPDASAKKVRGGWLRMGDIGHTDEDGWFFFDYRAGGAIRRNGDFVDPSFIEKALAEYPGVDDVFVYGIDAASGAPGEKDVVAAVVAAQDVAFNADELYSYCRQTLEPNFVPSYIQLMDEIPKTASEKPQERFCLEQFREQPSAVFIDTTQKTQTGRIQ